MNTRPKHHLQLLVFVIATSLSAWSQDEFSWQQVGITIDGLGIIPDQIQIERITGLSVTPQHSLFISIKGVADNVGVRLNLTLRIHHLNYCYSIR